MKNEVIKIVKINQIECIIQGEIQAKNWKRMKNEEIKIEKVTHFKLLQGEIDSTILFILSSIHSQQQEGLSELRKMHVTGGEITWSITFI